MVKDKDLIAGLQIWERKLKERKPFTIGSIGKDEWVAYPKEDIDMLLRFLEHIEEQIE